MTDAAEGEMTSTGMGKNLKAELKRLIEVEKSGLPPDGGVDFNRLIFAASPYLLQHAENRVEWFEWSDEAFARARNENKPVFLSIGYATCHWCHVMERESFEDREVAEVLNRNFIAIKVDREERPDIDDLYMAAAHMMTGSGGWPLNLFLTPDKKPFYASSYIPRTARHGMAGIIEIMEKIADIWDTRRDSVESTSDAVMKELAAIAEPVPAPLSGGDVFAAAFRQLEMLYDSKFSGFGPAPRFPRPLIISFLIRYSARKGNTAALAMAEDTLLAMRNGGIYDHLGFGFHRYSVDKKWLVPHFEKMLYDQAMLALAYIDAFKFVRNPSYADMAKEIFGYVLREMTSPGGGFYSAEDADLEGVEGKYYVWTPGEIEEVLGEDDGKIFCTLYGVTRDGNFEGENILHLRQSVDKFAESGGTDPSVLTAQLESWRKLLLSRRDERIKPLRDEKILASWNGLMIVALARGFAVTDDFHYLDAARGALDFIKKQMITPEGRLLHSNYLGQSGVPAFLEDYSFLVWGLLELYEATLEPQYLDDAMSFSKETLRLFVDEENFGLFDSGSDVENVLIRKKSALDGVMPSGNSVAAMNFLKIGKITKKPGYVEEGGGILRSLMGNLLEQPIGYLNSLAALDYLDGPDLDITVAGEIADPESKEMLTSIRKRYIPGLTLRIRVPGEERGDYKRVDGKTALYVCTQLSCLPPVTGYAPLESLLDELLP